MAALAAGSDFTHTSARYRRQRMARVRVRLTAAEGCRLRNVAEARMDSATLWRTSLLQSQVKAHVLELLGLGEDRREKPDRALQLAGFGWGQKLDVDVSMTPAGNP